MSLAALEALGLFRWLVGGRLVFGMRAEHALEVVGELPSASVSRCSFARSSEVSRTFHRGVLVWRDMPSGHSRTKCLLWRNRVHSRSLDVLAGSLTGGNDD